MRGRKSKNKDFSLFLDNEKDGNSQLNLLQNNEILMISLLIWREISIIISLRPAQIPNRIDEFFRIDM